MNNINVEVTPEGLQSLHPTVQGEILRALAKAVTEHQRSRSTDALVTLSEQVQGSVWMHAQPGFTEAHLAAPTKPIGRGYSIDEIFAQTDPQD